MPEYGRHIHNLVSFAKTIEDREERQNFASYIIKLMLQMSPNAKGGGDFEEKMWVHLFIISGYDLDVSPPIGEIPVKSVKLLEPQPIGYPKRNHKNRHYGQHVQTLISKCKETEESPKKEEFKEVIGSFMKLAFKNWSREHYISDDAIKQDLAAMSDGELVIPDGQGLNKIAAANKPYVNKTNTSTNRNSRRKSYSKNSGGSKRNFRKRR